MLSTSRFSAEGSSSLVADPLQWVADANVSALKHYVYTNLDQVLIRDGFSIKRNLNGLTQAIAKQTSEEQKQANTERCFELLARMEKSAIALRNRHDNAPVCSYPDLPVSDRKEDILTAIQTNQVVIIAGETGSGKTTQLPKMCLDAGLGRAGMIAHTQPRRLAARSVAGRIAEEIGTPLGETVGYKVRFSDQVSDNTLIKLMTDGMLLAEMQQDKFLNAYDTIIIDEAHERSLNIDFILGYLKQLLPKRPDLKVIITSATIDPERFSRHFNNAPIIEVSGRTYPVEIRYQANEDDTDSDQIDNIITAVDELYCEPAGDILVFLSGEREIRDTQDALQKQQYRHTEIIPLYARLSANEQNKVFKPHSGRRIVLATNVAETSLTVPGIKYVIDPGTARISRYSARTKVQRLPIEAISQASANQRAGRCGRVSDGICIRLYSEQDYMSRPEFTDPEILRTNLASVILQMLALGLGDIAKFPFVEPPDNRNINDGYRLLDELEAITTSKGKRVLTQEGRRLSKLPIDPRYARMVLAADAMQAVKEVVIIAAGLSIQDPRERPQDKKQVADERHNEFADRQSDFISLLNLWNEFTQQQATLTNNQLRKWCKQYFVHYLRMREWQDIVSQIKKSLAEVNIGLNSQPANGDAIHKALLNGLLSHIGMKDKEEGFLGARNSRFFVFPGSSLAKKPPKWVMSAELVETSRLFARINAKIEPEWIEPLAKHLTKSHFSEPHWSKKRGAVMAYEKVTLLGVPIVAKRSTNYGNIDPTISREIFVREALINGDTNLHIDVLNDNLSMLDEAEDLEQKTRRRDWVVSEDALVDFYLERLPEHVVSEASFRKWWKRNDAKTALRFTEADIYKQLPSTATENAFPEHWQQGHFKLPLKYHFEPTASDDGVTVQIPLPLVNQVVDEGFDWLVPGLRHERVVNLIKGLPKKLRKNFVPAPQYADAVLADMQMLDKAGKPVSMIAALTEKLFRMTGVKLQQGDWNEEALPRHLVMHFAVMAERGKILAFGDNLAELQQQMQGKVKTTFAKAKVSKWERKDLISWDFDNLPDTFTQRHGGYDVHAFPALVTKGKQINIELLESAEKAKTAHRQGVIGLLKLAMPSPLGYLQDKLPNKAKLGLYFNPFGKVSALIDDCIWAGIDSLLKEYCQFTNWGLRSKSGFTECEKFVRGRINEQVVSIASKVEQGLTLAHGVQKQLKGKVALNMIQSMGHIKSHLDSLVYSGFVSEVGEARLDDWLRYLKAIEKRVEKAKIDPHRDSLNQMAVEKVEREWQTKVAAYAHTSAPVALLEVRWMIEEFRVSLFAQQLGTKMPISAKRITLYLQEAGD